MSSISSELSNYSSTNTIKNSCVSWSDKNFWTKFKRLLPKPTSPIPHCLLGGENGTNLQNEIYNNSSCDPSQLPYNLVMNPNLAQLHHLQQLQQQQQTLRSNHYHSNILPYQIPVPNGMMSRTNSLLPPVPKHQIVLPANSNNNGLHQHNHNAIISSSTTNNSLIHPIPSQLTPQAFGYSNETFHLQQNNHHQNFVNHHHPNNNHNQPIHFSSPQQNPHHQHHPLHHQQMHPVIIPPHSHHHHPQHLHTASQVSNNFSTSLLYPHHHQQTSSTTRGDDQPNYSSSAVSSCAEFDHVYSTLDSPIQSPGLLTSDRVDYSPNGGGGGPTNNTVDSRNSSKHTVQHSTSSGVSSGSDMTCGGESSSAVSPSSPIKNGILNKLNAHMNSNNNPGGSSNTNQNGKMYFV